jgi:spore germination protein GerM
MTLPRAVATATIGLLVTALGVTAYLTRPLWRATPSRATALPTPSAPQATSGRKIKAHLFYVSEDGTRLTSVERDVPFAEGLDQAREIIAAQIAPVAEPLLSAIPPGTSLRALYITDRGEAYVDLSQELAMAHTGGTLDELLTVFTIVDALTANLPAVQSVQILVGGKEVPTLAGHVDLRQPLAKDLALVQ